MRYRKGVKIFIFNQNKELLLVSSAKKPDFWKVPSGGIKDGEASYETVLREIKEEFNVEAKIKFKSKYKNKFLWPKELVEKIGFIGQEQEVFFAEISNPEKIKIDPNEIADYKWVKSDKINEFLKLQNQRDLAKKVIDEYENN